MQLMGYDAMAIGNHEFEFGYRALSEEMARVPFPVLGANLAWAGTDHPYAQPWTILERDGVRVGVIGVLGEDAATALIPSNIAGVDVTGPVAALQRLVPQLREEVDLVVLLVHQGPTAPMQTDDEADPAVFRGNRENLALAGAVSGIDVIFAGHADAGTPRPLVHPDTGTLIMQTWGQAQHLGFLRVQLAERGGVAAWEGRLIPVNADRLKPLPGIRDRLQAWRDRHPDLQAVVGHTAGVLTRRYYRESTLGNLLADLVAEAAGTEIGLMPSGALRRDLPAGPVRREELADAFPFEDRTARVTLTGAVLERVLEQGFSLARGLLQISGLTVYVDSDAPAGERVLGVCVGDEPLRPEASYIVGTLEILAQGGDAYVQFREAEDVEYLEGSFAEALEDAFGAVAEVSVPGVGRVREGDAEMQMDCGGA